MESYAPGSFFSLEWEISAWLRNTWAYVCLCYSSHSLPFKWSIFLILYSRFVLRERKRERDMNLFSLPLKEEFSLHQKLWDLFDYREKVQNSIWIWPLHILCNVTIACLYQSRLAFYDFVFFGSHLFHVFL